MVARDTRRVGDVWSGCTLTSHDKAKPTEDCPPQPLRRDQERDDGSCAGSAAGNA